MLETERLYIRPFVPDDLPLVIKLYQDYEVMRYHPGQHPKSLERIVNDLNAILDAQEKNGFSFWAVHRKNDHQFIGRAGLTFYDKEKRLVELGYCLFKEFWGQGYATEMSKQVIHFAFEILKLKELFATIHQENHSSERVAKKLGFEFVTNSIYHGMPIKLYNLQNRLLPF